MSLPRCHGQYSELKCLSIKAKFVYIALLDYAWQQGSCYPGQVRRLTTFNLC